VRINKIVFTIVHEKAGTTQLRARPNSTQFFKMQRS